MPEGDNQSPSQEGFPCAPTVGREMLQTLMAILVNRDDFLCSPVDVSRDFLQSDVLDKESHVVALATDCIVLNEEGWIGGIISLYYPKN